MSLIDEQIKRINDAQDRYRARFRAANGEDAEGEIQRTASLLDDYRLFGDIIEPKVLNSVNVEATNSYMDIFVRKLQEAADPVEDELAAQAALGVLRPVMMGMFEHVWLLGYLYYDEEVREKFRLAAIETERERVAERRARRLWWLPCRRP